MNLLSEDLKDRIVKTESTRKLTLDGKTQIYPVYRVPLDLIYYNDQNDRIATWISQYKNENGASQLDPSNRDAYNAVIERFIIESNPTAIEKTKTNIELVGQREAGVVLADGRVIDGNRRFTCLRMIQREDPSINTFETVILDKNLENSKKQIKMLELAIQHGEEKKVDYNLIDLVVGAYQDIIETELLTIDEYASSTNESITDVRKRLEIGKLVTEYLEYIHMPKQYYIARDQQVYSIFFEVLPLLKKCSNDAERQKLKETVFSNLMMNAVVDGRKYIRSLSSMMESGFFSSYMKEQEKLRDGLQEVLSSEAEFSSKKDLEAFVSEQDELAEDLQISFDKSLLKAKKKETRSKPSQMVSKSISMLKDVDTRIFEKLNDDEKDHFREQLGKLSGVIERYGVLVDDGTVTGKEDEGSNRVQPEIIHKEDKSYRIGEAHAGEPILYVRRPIAKITTLSFSLNIDAVLLDIKEDTGTVINMFFTDENDGIVSNINSWTWSEETSGKYTFVLDSRMSEQKKAYLIMKSVKDKENECQRKIPFDIDIVFGSDFDF